MARIQSNKICFTLNNHDEQEVTRLIDWVIKESDKIGYFICGDEVGENGTPHLQGYMRLVAKRRFGIKHWKSIVGTRAHIENAKGTDHDNNKYCKKSGRFIEYGDMHEGAQTIHGNCLQDLQEMAEFTEWIAKYPEEALKHFHNANAIRNITRKAIPFELPELYKWQRSAVGMLDGQGDREILFVVDQRGGCGKSVLCKWLMDNRDAFGCQGIYLSSI